MRSARRLHRRVARAVPRRSRVHTHKYIIYTCIHVCHRLSSLVQQPMLPLLRRTATRPAGPVVRISAPPPRPYSLIFFHTHTHTRPPLSACYYYMGIFCVRIYTLYIPTADARRRRLRCVLLPLRLSDCYMALYRAFVYKLISGYLSISGVVSNFGPGRENLQQAISNCFQTVNFVLIFERFLIYSDWK